jgi:hypothetical protein
MGDETRDARPYVDRNQTIVDESLVLVAAFKGFSEELRPGTWDGAARTQSGQGSVRGLARWPNLSGVIATQPVQLNFHPILDKDKNQDTNNENNENNDNGVRAGR